MQGLLCPPFIFRFDDVDCNVQLRKMQVYGWIPESLDPSDELSVGMILSM